MSEGVNRPERTFTRIAVAIVLAALVIGGSIFISSAAASHTVTEIVPSTVLQTTTVVQTVTGTLTGADASSETLHELVFTQNIACPAGTSLAGDFVYPWSVALNGSTTIVNPPNANISTKYPYDFSVSQNSSLGTIVFSVPDGIYDFALFPYSVAVSGPVQTGTVTIDGSNTAVQVYQMITGCGYSVTASNTAG